MPSEENLQYIFNINSPPREAGFAAVAQARSTPDLFYDLSHPAYFIGVISFIIWAYVNLADKKVSKNIYNAPVDNTSVNAVNSNVATGGSTINQSTEINNSGGISSSLNELRELITGSDLDENGKKYASLLLDNIESESTKEESDKKKLSEYFGEFESILKSSGTIASVGLKAFTTLKTFLS